MAPPFLRSILKLRAALGPGTQVTGYCPHHPRLVAVGGKSVEVAFDLLAPGLLQRGCDNELVAVDLQRATYPIPLLIAWPAGLPKRGLEIAEADDRDPLQQVTVVKGRDGLLGPGDRARNTGGWCLRERGLDERELVHRRCKFSLRARLKADLTTEDDAAGRTLRRSGARIAHDSARPPCTSARSCSAAPSRVRAIALASLPAPPRDRFHTPAGLPRAIALATR